MTGLPKKIISAKNQSLRRVEGIVAALPLLGGAAVVS
jgi:hypothetical protein